MMEKFKQIIILSFFSIFNGIFTSWLIFFMASLDVFNWFIVFMVPIIISILFCILSYKLFFKIVKIEFGFKPPFLRAFLLSVISTLFIIGCIIDYTSTSEYVGDEGIIFAGIFYFSVIIDIGTLVLHNVLYSLSKN